MNNELIEKTSWHKRHKKWLLPVLGIVIIVTVAFFSSGMNKVVVNITKAYADTALYEKALSKAKSNQSVIELLGEIEPIDKLAILEGFVEYSNNNNTVNTTIRIKGKKLNAKMDIAAIRINNEWDYKKIKVRVNNPPTKKQTIEIIPHE